MALQHLAVSTLAPTSIATPLSSRARNAFKASFERFEQTVKNYSHTDHRDFSSTTLLDVRQAARQVEQQLAARQCLRNMSRLEPLLNGLEAYSKVVEVLCNGTPYVAWIWAPIKLTLKLASDYLGAFEKLIAAYGQIAENLPRFDRLSNAYRNNADFQQVLAVVYSDIIEFHRKAYKFFRKAGWKCFFSSAWGRFDARFSCILDSLSRHSDLVDREANALAIAETVQWRKEQMHTASLKAKEKASMQSTASIAWLNLDSTCGQGEQEDTLDKLTSDCCPGTTEWILKHQKMKSWLKEGRASPILWLKGKPGSGKSTLCAKIVQFVRADKRSTLLFCFYGYRMSALLQHPSRTIFATLISQILRQHRNLSGYVYEDFVVAGRAPSVQTLKDIFKTLIVQVKSPRIIIDGIDECIHYDASGSPRDLGIIRDVIQDVLQLSTIPGANVGVKLLISSRDILQVFDKLAKKPVVALDDESDHIRAAIRTYTSHRLTAIRTRFDNFSEISCIVDALENKIVLKSQEMFLWARLVLMQIEEDAFTINDLERAISDMPTSLNDFYARILSKTKPLGPSSRERVTTILKWLICSRRPLRAIELQDAIAFSASSTLDENSKLPTTVIHLCKPLIQVLSDATVVFVHFTVQEYLVSSGFISLVDAEQCVTNCCLNYVQFSLNLIDPRVQHDQRIVEVGKCLYSLQSYTHEHWLDHLLSGATRSAASSVAFTHIKSRLNYLLEFLENMQIWSTTTMHPLDEAESLATLEPRLLHFENEGRIFEFIVRLVQQREHTKSNFGDQEETSEWNPLVCVQDEYQKAVILLLSSQSFPGLDDGQLSTFKTLFSPYVFSCRFPDCASKIAGFPSAESRAEHEKTHAPPLLCSHLGCTYPLPFKNVAGLQRHIRENHTGRTARIPRSVRPSSGSRNPVRQPPPGASHFKKSAPLPANYHDNEAKYSQDNAHSHQKENAGKELHSSGRYPSWLTPEVIEWIENFRKAFLANAPGQENKIDNVIKAYGYPNNESILTVEEKSLLRFLKNSVEGLQRSSLNEATTSSSLKLTHVSPTRTMSPKQASLDLEKSPGKEDNSRENLQVTWKPSDHRPQNEQTRRSQEMYQIVPSEVPGAYGQPLTEAARMSMMPNGLDPSVKAQLVKLPEVHFRTILAQYMVNMRQNNAIPNSTPTPAVPMRGISRPQTPIMAQDPFSTKVPGRLPRQEELAVKMRDPTVRRKYKALLAEEHQKLPPAQPVQMAPDVRAALQQWIKSQWQFVKKYDQAMCLCIVQIEEAGGNPMNIGRSVIRARLMLSRQMKDYAEGILKPELTLSETEIKWSMNRLTTFVQGIIGHMLQQQQPEPGKERVDFLRNPFFFS